MTSLLFLFLCVVGASAALVSKDSKGPPPPHTDEAQKREGAAKAEVTAALSLVGSLSQFSAAGEDMARKARVRGAVTHLPVTMNHTGLPFAPEVFGPYIRILGVKGGVLVGGRAAPSDIAGLVRAMLRTNATESSLHELAWRLVDTAVVVLDLIDHIEATEREKAQKATTSTHLPLKDYANTSTKEFILSRTSVFVALASASGWRSTKTSAPPPKSDV